MNAVSLFAGIEGIGLGLERQGIKVACQVEWDAAASRVLAHHFPDVPRFTDVREVTADDVRAAVRGPVDVLTGGFPCQDVSVAGRRAGVAEGTRSGLYRELVRLAETLAPEWLVVENVPGLLSADDGRAFALVLGDLTGWEPAVPEDGWRSSGVCVGPLRSAAWRVLDAQHFGVAQRRRRVFIVCHSGDRAAPAAVLLEPEGVRGNPPPGGTSWAHAAGSVDGGADTISTLQGGGRRGYRVDAEGAAGGHLIPTLTAAMGSNVGHPGDSGKDEMILAVAEATALHEVAPALTARYGKGTDSDATDALCITGQVTHALTAEGADASEDGTGRGTPIIGFSHTQGLDAQPSETAFPTQRREDGGHGVMTPGGPQDANAHEGDAREVLHRLWDALGTEAAQEWGAGVAAALQPPAVLQPGVHEGGLPPQTEDDIWKLVNDASAGPALEAGWSVRGLRDITERGRPPRQPRLAGQLAGQLEAALSPVPHPVASSVRRLTPREAERLQGFPDDWTLIPGTSDSARYRQLGNAVCVNVSEWVGWRIAAYQDGWRPSPFRHELPPEETEAATHVV